ncbi:hypothetical protein R5M72_21120, partial [Acinetobacter baumannii]|nr:hypothetical protein [Acinetobacter baumannii]
EAISKTNDVIDCVSKAIKNINDENNLLKDVRQVSEKEAISKTNDVIDCVSKAIKNINDENNLLKDVRQ